MAIFICYPLLVLSMMYLQAVQAQYLDNRDDPYLPPYVRHSPAANHRSVGVSGLSKQQPIDDLPPSQSLFMMDFKRQAIVIPETSEKLSKNSSNHTVIEKYIIDSNSPEYQQLLQKMVSVEKRQPPFFLQANQAMASSSRSTSISKADGDEHEHSSLSISEKENQAKGSMHSGLLKHKYLQPPYDTSYHHHLISSKPSMSMDLDKKESSSKYATVVASDDKQAHLFVEDRLRGSLNGTMSEEMTLRRLQGQLRASLETLLVQLGELRAVAEHEIKKLCPDDSSCRDHPNDAVKKNSHMAFSKEYDHDQRGHHFNLHYVTKYSS